MIVETYFSKVGEGIEFLIAFVSIIGFLGIIVGILMLLMGNKNSAVKLIVISFIIVAITGMYTGINYFHIR